MLRRTRGRPQIQPANRPHLLNVNANTTGFAALPYELYFEILSYWPPFPIPTEVPTNYDSLDLRQRRFTIHALSQTCSSLGQVFLPYVWERIEVYDGMVTNHGPLPFHVFNAGYGRIKTAIHKKYAEELVRQLETVTIRDPSLAQYVHTLNILVTDFSVKTVLEELARCIKVLPNLHTVQLNFGFSPEKQGVENTFATEVYPQIRTACLSLEARFFMFACPNLRRISAYQGRGWPICIPFKLNSVETLGLLYDHRSVHLRRIVGVMPQLHDITLGVYMLCASWGASCPFKCLSTLLHLRTIRIKLNGDFSEAQITDRIQDAVDILSKIPDNSDSVKRKVIVTHPDGEVQVFNVQYSAGTSRRHP